MCPAKDVIARQPGGREREGRIAAVRRFNRLYTRQLGVLRKTYLDSPYSLGEARVLYEIAGRPETTASEVCRTLDVDAGYLSRLLRDLERSDLIRRTVSADDARQTHLRLSPRGRKALAPLERRSARQAGAMLDKLTAVEQARLVAAMAAIESLIGRTAESVPSADGYRLRAPRPGDFGWIVQRHAEIYAREYGWTEPFEGLCAQIVAEFANRNDRQRERCWIAEIAGENVGSAMLVRETEEVARLRLLLVDPRARGLGLGARLTQECIAFARDAGYGKITLWTHAVLTAARHIYQKAGFTLTRRESHNSWGRPVVSEHWDLML